MEIVVIVGAIIAFFVLSVIISMMFRVVVPTNEVHILQRSKSSVPYGKDMEAGNVYYNWPSWMPFIGINKIILPVSNFNVELKGYEAYDKQKVPFEVDVIGFFRISNPIEAAQKISSFADLDIQLNSVMNGAIRKVLAGHEIIKIMESRNEISDAFTNEVSAQLKNWGVESVKNVELMDIRDSEKSDSNVISNIMIRKTSEIERESRIEVANNKRDAEVAEIDAKRVADVQRQDAERQVGEKTADKEKAVGIAREKSTQDVQSEARITMEKTMEVRKVEQVKSAEIAKAKAVIEAEQKKASELIIAEGQKLQMAEVAEGKLITQKKLAEGVQAEGLATAEAKRALEVALIAGQIALAEKIQNSPEYIEYLKAIREIEAGEKVGISKADALKAAKMQIISNAGNVDGGVTSLMDILSGKGGASIGSMLENLRNTDAGAALVEKFLPSKKTEQVHSAPVAPVSAPAVAQSVPTATVAQSAPKAQMPNIRRDVR